MAQRKLTITDMLFADTSRICPADVVRVERKSPDGTPLGHDTLIVKNDLSLLLVKTHTNTHPLTQWETLFHYLADQHTFFRITLNDRGYDPNYPLPFPHLRSYHKLNATHPTMNINYE